MSALWEGAKKNKKKGRERSRSRRLGEENYAILINTIYR